MHAEFLINRMQVKSDGVNADPQFRRRGVILMAHCQQLQQPQLLRLLYAQRANECDLNGLLVEVNKELKAAAAASNHNNPR
jgi:hypothetical protein